MERFFGKYECFVFVFCGLLLVKESCGVFGEFRLGRGVFLEVGVLRSRGVFFEGIRSVFGVSWVVRRVGGGGGVEFGN